jgi:hypothetical protein
MKENLVFITLRVECPANKVSDVIVVARTMESISTLVHVTVQNINYGAITTKAGDKKTDV